MYVQITANDGQNQVRLLTNHTYMYIQYMQKYQGSVRIALAG